VIRFVCGKQTITCRTVSVFVAWLSLNILITPKLLSVTAMLILFLQHSFTHVNNNFILSIPEKKNKILLRGFIVYET